MNLLHTIQAHQRFGLFSHHPKLWKSKSSFVGRDLLLSLLSSIPYLVKAHNKKRHQHFLPLIEKTGTHLCFTNFKIPMPIHTSLTRGLFLLCWLNLNCSGNRMNVREASRNKLMVVPRGCHGSKLGRM